MAKKSTNKAPKVAVGKLQSDFDKFWSHKVKLNADMSKQRQNIFANIKNQLTPYLPNGISINKILLEGSATLRTSISPDYDADIAVVMNPRGASPLKVDYFDSLFKAACRTYGRKDKTPVKKLRAITIQYGDNFHLDIVPCIQAGDAMYVCDEEGKRHRTNSEGHQAWLDDKDNLVGGNNLRKTIQIIKHLKDRDDESVAKSVVITTLLGHHIGTINKKSRFKDLPSTFTILLDRLDRWLRGQKKAPNIRNPAKGERFSRNWNPEKYERFRNMIHGYNETAKEAYRLWHNHKYDESKKLWQELFGPQFGDIS